MSRIVNYTCVEHGKIQIAIRCGYGNGPAPKSVQCHAPGCSLIASRYRRFRDRKSRRALSVTADTYKKILTYCEQHGLSADELIDALTQDLK